MASQFLPLALIGLIVTAAAPLRGPLQAAESGPVTDAIQVLADLTLIDGACRSDSVNFGIGFRFASEKGMPPVSIMPGGTRREEFDAVLRSRRAQFSQNELCNEIAANYAEALPGSVTLPAGTGQR